MSICPSDCNMLLTSSKNAAASSLLPGISVSMSIEHSGNTAKYKLSSAKLFACALTVKLSPSEMLPSFASSRKSRLSAIPGTPMPTTICFVPSPTLKPFDTSIPPNTFSGRIISPAAITGKYTPSCSQTFFILTVISASPLLPAICFADIFLPSRRYSIVNSTGNFLSVVPV